MDDPQAEWILTNVADMTQLGTSKRIREKMTKLSQLTHEISSSKQEVKQQLEVAVTEARREAEVARREAEVATSARREAEVARREAEVATSARREAEVARREAEVATNARREAEVVVTIARREAEVAVAEARRQTQLAEARAQDLEGRLVREQGMREREAIRRAGESDKPWLVRRAEIHMTSEKLGGGGWGEVKVAEFRGVRVAAKVLFKQLQSPYYHNIFIREMNMASRVRHPNLVQFIGASMDTEKVILMELMPNSLRQHLADNAPSIPSTAFRRIVSLDVARALNYLHLMQPDPIIHRDISSANVLLEPLSNHSWRAKVTDYGSVNLQNQLTTKNPGNPVYSAPESSDPSMQTTKMDIFSFGVLLAEMCTAQFPEVATREAMIRSISDRHWVDMIRGCIQEDQLQRPSAARITTQLKARQ